MRDLYASHAAALRDDLRHAVERGSMSSQGVQHQGVPSPSTLTGTDATGQVARIRRQLDRLAPLPRSLKCSCGSRCCAGLAPRTAQLRTCRKSTKLLSVSCDAARNSYSKSRNSLGVDQKYLIFWGLMSPPGELMSACNEL